MMRVLFVLGFAAPLLWCQAGGRYHYAAISIKSGPAFLATVRAGSVSIAKQGAARFSFDDPSAPGRSLSVAASPTGAIVAGAVMAGLPELFVALRAPEPGQPVTLAPGEWSAVMFSFNGGKARGVTTAFIDFTVTFNGAISNPSIVAHDAAVDDVCRAEPVEFKLGESSSLEMLGVTHALAVGAKGDSFLATSSTPTHPSFVLGVRRDRDASTMAMRGAYALSEIGGRNSFGFAPDQARFYSTAGALQANGGQARISQIVTAPGGGTQFAGSVAYMLSSGGAGTFSPRLEPRRRNLAVSDDGGVFITAQVAEAGKLSLLHGVGVGLRVVEQVPPSLANRATAQGNIVSLYGSNLDGVQVLIGGRPAAVVHAWPNQINVRLAAPPVSPLSVELDWSGGRTSSAIVAIAATPPEYASAPAAPGGMIAPDKPASPGETIELGITGAAPPGGSRLLFDGVPGTVVSSSWAAGATQFKVILPKTLTPADQVNVAIAAPGSYVDLGDIAVSRPRATAPAAASATH